jgi:predicted ATPase/DNA-binding SARP family transcriptional activator
MGLFAVPVQPTNLIGRTREITEARYRLLRVRLLSLTGPPGVGKTRLALAVAEQLRADFEDGIVFVDLVPITDTSAVVPAIAQAMGVRDAPGQPLPLRLKGHLADRQVLLVLDNVEHLLDAAPVLADILGSCPAVKMLVTSRSSLRVSWEHEYPVAPLAVPTLDPLPPVGELADVPAVRLFVERATAAEPDFSLTEHNGRAIAEICARLDGLPLAIELAAARAKVLPPEAILQRLHPRLELLTSGRRDLPARHQTLRRAIAWSHDLLEEPERALLRQLSVFVGGATLPAVEAVCQLPPGGSIIEALTSLVDKSLLRRADPGPEPQFRMLETIREFAAEQLQGSDEAGAAQRRHAQFYLTLAEAADAQLSGPAQAQWLDRLELEHDNLRAALQWSIDAGETDTGLRLAAALGRFWERHGYSTEGRTWLRMLLAAPRAGFDALYGRAVNIAGNLARAQGDYDVARQMYRESLAIRDSLGDRRGASASLNNLGVAAKDQGDYATARAYFERSLDVKRDLGDTRGIALTLSNLGLTLKSQGRTTEAEQVLADSLRAFLDLPDPWGVALALSNLGAAAAARGDYDTAHGRYLDSLQRRWVLKDRWGIAECLEGVAAARAAIGRSAEAAQLLGAAEAIRETLGFPIAPDERINYDRLAAAIRQGMSAETLSAAWQIGRAMPLAAAVELALSTGAEPVTPGPGPLRVAMLGGFRLAVGRHDVPEDAWGRPQALAVFQYLVLHRDRSVTADEMVEVFWPDARAIEDTPLYTTLSRIRRTLQQVPGLASVEVLTKARTGYRLIVPAGVSVDVHEFEATLRSARQAQAAGHLDAAGRHLTHALTLYRGDLLDGAPYNDWAGLEREALRRQFLDAALLLGRIDEMRGQVLEAADAYRRALEREPWTEAAHRGLMRCYVAEGRRDAALRQYQTCRILLREHLDVDPDPETDALHQAILDGAPLPAG